MTNEELQKIRELAESRLSDASGAEVVAQVTILQLLDELERLNKEADWLADHCREFCESYSYCGECPMFSGWLKRDHEDCGETVGYRGEQHTANWREAARNAVKEVPNAD